MRVLVVALAALLLVAAVNPALGAVDADAQRDESISLPPSSLVSHSVRLSVRAPQRTHRLPLFRAQSRDSVMVVRSILLGVF